MVLRNTNEEVKKRDREERKVNKRCCYVKLRLSAVGDLLRNMGYILDLFNPSSEVAGKFQHQPSCPLQHREDCHQDS
jgi:hypothetical protein